jgi:hypothetical protein
MEHHTAAITLTNTRKISPNSDLAQRFTGTEVALNRPCDPPDPSRWRRRVAGV